MHSGAAEAPFPHRHLLDIEGPSRNDIDRILIRAPVEMGAGAKT
jgi:hypothetical protein